MVSYNGSREVLGVIERLGRTEDIKFSPSCRRFAVAGFAQNKLALFDISVANSSPEEGLTLVGAAEIFSASFDHPHGLDFIDDETLVVANRNGSAWYLHHGRRRCW